MRIFVAFLVSALPLTGIAAVAQDIVPDGTTATSVSAIDGRSIVQVAPSDARGISLNRFSKFDIPQAGASLDNQAVGASTIVTEVTSTRTTRLEGSLSVLGRAANVVIANPNGIVADGASFNNVDAVALATASFSAAVPGEPQLHVSGGTVEVGTSGLSGVMSELDLIARDIRIAGNVRVDHPASGGAVVIAAGHSTSALVSGAGPFMTTLATGVAAPPERPQSIAVDIAGETQLKAGSIRVHVTEAGAGVRMAGDVIATRGDVRLSADGHVRFTDAHIQAHGAVSTSAKSVSISSSSRRSEISSASSGITIKGRDGVSAAGARISGVQRDFGDFASQGAVTILTERGDIDLAAKSTFATTIDASGELVALAAGGDIASRGVTIRSAHDVLMSAAREMLTQDAIIAASRNISLLSAGKVRLADTELLADADIRMDGASFGISSSDGRRSKIVAASGAVSISARQGSIVNEGSLIEGRRASLSDPDAVSAVAVTAATDIINQSLSADRLGVFFGREGDLVVTAGGNISNLTARLFSNASIKLNAGESITSATTLSSLAESFTHVSRGKRSWRTLWLKPETREQYVASFGLPAIEGEQSLITAIGDVDGLIISSHAFRSEGITVPYTVLRPAGLASMYQGRNGWVGETWTGGVLAAPNGRVHVASGEPAVLIGTEIFAEQGINIDPGGLLSQAPEPALLFRRPIGIMAGGRL